LIRPLPIYFYKKLNQPSSAIVIQLTKLLFAMSQAAIFVQTALKAWNQQLNRADKFFDQLSDEQLLQEVAPGKNRAVYLLGHLVAVNDSMVSLFGLGDRMYAHLDEAFIKNPDRSGIETPDVGELRSDWKRLKEALTVYFEKMTPEEWLGKHTAMTDEDLLKEPARNKLSVLLNRTSHMAYHIGQLVFIK